MEYYKHFGPLQGLMQNKTGEKCPRPEGQVNLVVLQQSAVGDSAGSDVLKFYTWIESESLAAIYDPSISRPRRKR